MSTSSGGAHHRHRPHHHHPSSSSIAATHALLSSAGSTTSTGTPPPLPSNEAIMPAVVSKQQQQPPPSTITTLASPTSSASSSMCSSPRSSSCSECSECEQDDADADAGDAADPDAPSQQAVVVHRSNRQRQPRNSTSHTCCPHRRRHHHHHRRNHPTTTTIASTSSSQALHHNSHHDHHLFSPITSNGSVISSESSSKSRPTSPLKSSITSILPSLSSSAAPAPPVGNTPASNAGGTDSPDDAVKESTVSNSTAPIHDGSMDTDDDGVPPASSSLTTEEVGTATSEQSSGATAASIVEAEITSAAAPPQVSQTNPISSKSRKSARRHSENGMKNPDDSFYPSTYLPFNSSSTSSSSLASSNGIREDGQVKGEEGKTVERFIAPSLNSRNSSTMAVGSSSSSFNHPGTPAINGSSSTNSSANTTNSSMNIPLTTAPSSAMMGIHGGMQGMQGMQGGMMNRNPGERRIQNEEMRPARRKVHRVDTSSSSSTTTTTTPSSSYSTTSAFNTPFMRDRAVGSGRGGGVGGVGGGQGRSYSTPALSRKNFSSGYNGGMTGVGGAETQKRPTPNGDSYFPQSHSAGMTMRSSTSNAILQSKLGGGGGGSSQQKDTSMSMSIDHPHNSYSQVQAGQQSKNNSSSSSSTNSTTTSVSMVMNNNANSTIKKKNKLAELKEKERNMNHMDIASFPTTTLLQLLAALLTGITLKNDAIRDGVVAEAGVDGSSSSSEVVVSSQAGSLDRNREKGEGDSQDEQMEGDSNQVQQEQNMGGSGTVTPPGQMYSHSRNTSNEPVTPAVPFSSPALSRNASSISNNFASSGGVRDRAGNDDGQKDEFEHDSRLTVSSSSAPLLKDTTAKEGTKDEECEGDAGGEDASLQPRHNFYRPPTSSGKSAGHLHQQQQQQQQQEGNASQPPSFPRSKSRTILTSAAQALAMPNATLCFHARNIPSISIEAYLIRISKYCPTTNEVFISLLVYFDRMSRLPNLSNLTSSLPSSNTQQQGSSTSNNNNSTSMSNTTSTSSNPTNHVATATATTQNTMPLFNYNSNSNSTPSTSHARTRSSSNPVESTSTSSGNTMQPSSSSPHSTFAVDSFNIHRLIIAGVTVASKFFSDVFYTNSRYAKVGGLPLAELNALELQFLLLNGFDLIVSPEELQRYADYLLIGALPPLASDSTDRFGSRSSSSLGMDGDRSGKATTTPVDTPPATRANTPSRTPSASSGLARHGLFGPALRQNRAQYEQPSIQPAVMPKSNTSATSATTIMQGQTSSTALSSAVMDASARPKTSTRSASESSTSASEASTVVPSESSVDTERGEVDHSTADESTGIEDEDEGDGDSRMTDVSGAPSPSVPSQSQSFAQFQNVHQQKESLPVNATLGADRDGFAIPARPRPPLSRTSSGGNGQRHPLLATSSGSKTPSNGGSSGGHLSGGKTSAAQNNISLIPNTKSSAGKASTNKGNVSAHRRDNSRTREWTLQQQQHMHGRDSGIADEDAEMADQE